MTQVLKVSKSGFDVLTTDNENLSFSSELASHSIYNTVEVTMGSGETSVTYSHNLGYVPKVWIFLSDSDGDGDFYRRIPAEVDLGLQIEYIDYYISSSDVYIESSHANERTYKIVVFTRSPNP